MSTPIHDYQTEADPYEFSGLTRIGSNLWLRDYPSRNGKTHSTTDGCRSIFSGEKSSRFQTAKALNAVMNVIISQSGLVRSCSLARSLVCHSWDLPLHIVDTRALYNNIVREESSYATHDFNRRYKGGTLHVIVIAQDINNTPVRRPKRLNACDLYHMIFRAETIE